MTTTIEELQREAWANSEAHGFHELEEPGPATLSIDNTLAQLMIGVMRLSGIAEGIREGTPNDLYREDPGITLAPEHLRPLARLMLIVTEATEAAEAIVMDEGDLGEELADILIRVGDFAQESGQDLQAAVEVKMEANKLRPYKHGKLA